VTDLHHEHIAVAEARRLRIPIVGICDTNVNPELVQYPVPSNDDAVKSLTLIIDYLAACAAPRQNFKEQPEEKPEARDERGDRRDRGDRPRGDRGGRGDRPRGDRNDRGDRGSRGGDRAPRGEAKVEAKADAKTEEKSSEE
jgi:hypothetical protein